MAFKIIRDYENEWQRGREIVAVLDGDADLASLPTEVAPGSTAIVAAEGGKVYMVNASGSWEVL